MNHLKFAFQNLWKYRGFTFVTITVLAVGIGANTAVFTVVNTLLFRALPYAEPERLALITASGASDGRVSYPFYETLRDQQRSFSSIALATDEVFNLTGHGDPEQVPSARTTWNFFPLLGVQPVAGRLFSESEDQPGGNPVVLVSHEFAVRLF